ncbi:efflux RND transporter periplasmic adaptor subunit [Luteolibacter sp. AS25]|uniref:efflux RND transporter periplasmic adaptor subunit n=1 Tax=Luteolibacter sp. AS25 TaxID=3135776 RepID=UPI00398B7368
MKRLLILPLLLLTQCKKDEQAGGAPPAMPIQVAHPILQEIALTETYTGRFTPIEEVALQARVSGYLESVHFVEGQKVKKGDLMFKIDSRVFDAAAAITEASVKQAEARLSLAKSSLDRSTNLVEKGAVSKEEFDTRTSELAQAEADLFSAQAGLRSAKLDQEFAEIHAPISGVAGNFNVTVGNFISGGTAGGTQLTTIVPHHPIHCTFEVDERRVLQFTRLFFEDKTNGRNGEGPEVEIAVSDSDSFDFKGKIDFSENQLDRSTATLQMRALVQNEDEFLTPGLFAQVRVPVGQPSDKLLIKDAALGFDQDKRFAWVLKEDNTVEKRYLQTGQLSGDLRIITDGLTKEDQVAVSGIQLLRPQVPVAPTTVPMVPEK